MSKFDNLPPLLATVLTERMRAIFEHIKSDCGENIPKDRPIDRVRVRDDLNPPRAVVVLQDQVHGRLSVEIPLSSDPRYPPQPTCEVCENHCIHQLIALSELLDWLETPHHDRRDEILSAAARDPWRQWLSELSGAVSQLELGSEAAETNRLWWSFNLAKRDLELYSMPIATGKPKKLRLDRSDQPTNLSSADQGALSAARWYKSQRRAAARDGREQEIYLDALAALINHPRVVQGPPGGLAWRIKPLKLRVELAELPQGLDVRLWYGQEELLREDVLQSPHCRFFSIDPKARTLGLFIPSPHLKLFLSTWAQKAVPVPEHAKAELLAQLSRVNVHIPVAADVDVIREQQVEPQLTLIAILTPLPDSGLHIEVKIRPILNGPLFTPGAGTEEVLSSNHLRQILKTQRNLSDERKTADELVRSTLLSSYTYESSTYLYAIPDIGPALDLINQLKSHPGVECQWPGLKWQAPISIGTQNINISIQKRADWLEIHGEAQIEGKRLELAVLLEAARRDRGYISLGQGQFAQLETQLRNTLSSLAEHSERYRKRLRILHTGIESLRSFSELLPDSAPIDQWRHFLASVESAKQLTPEPSVRLTEVLRPYQTDGFRWLSRLSAYGAGAILADDMGLGKTLQTIAVLEQRAEHGPQLVVAPASVVFNWSRELQKFAPQIRIKNYQGSRRHAVLQHAKPHTIILSSYGVLQKDMDQPSCELRKMEWTTLVIDEAQFIKNPRTRRARALKAIKANWKVALTGTPIENNVTEVWAIYHAIFPSLLGSFDYFRSKYLPEADAAESFSARPEHVKGTRPEQLRVATHALRQAIQPFLLRRTKTQVAKYLPDKTEITVDIHLSHRERALYDDARLAAIAQLEKEDIVTQTHLRIQILAALTRLRQLACHPKLVDAHSAVPSSKMERVLQIIHELREENRRALVFGQFTQHLSLLRHELDQRDWSYLYLDGKTPPNQREAIVDQFQSGQYPLFLISLKAGGTGLNLTAADTVIHLEPWWNPAVEDQATDRSHRLGQTQPVTVLRLVTRDTIEQKIVDLHQEKRQLVSELLEGTHQTAKLTSSELIKLISTNA